MLAASIPKSNKIGSRVESRGVLSSPQHRYGLTQLASTVSEEEGRAEAMAAPEMKRESAVKNLIVFVGIIVLFKIYRWKDEEVAFEPESAGLLD